LKLIAARAASMSRAAEAAAQPSSLTKVTGGLLALLALKDLVFELVALARLLEARALDVGDVQEDVLGAVLGLDEAETLGCVEPLNGADGHDLYPIKQKAAEQYCSMDHLHFETETNPKPK
jgi:hypothetical protein